MVIVDDLEFLSLPMNQRCEKEWRLIEEDCRGSEYPIRFGVLLRKKRQFAFHVKSNCC
jgi:hypothetical protein